MKTEQEITTEAQIFMKHLPTFIRPEHWLWPKKEEENNNERQRDKQQMTKPSK